MIYTNGVIRTVIHIYLGSLLTVEVRLGPSYWKIYCHKSWPQVITIEKIMSYHERLHPYTVLVGKTPLSCSHRLFFLWNDVEQNFCNYKECRYDVQYHALLHWNIFTQLSSLFKSKCCYMLLTQHGKIFVAVNIHIPNQRSYVSSNLIRSLQCANERSWAKYAWNTVTRMN